ncbi:MAG: alpha/beta fold hydrolase [Victivallaceae bacterium]
MNFSSLIRRELILPLGERNVRISYLDSGTEAEPLLLLPGLLPQGAASFRPLIGEFPDEFRVIALDFPGFGHSEHCDLSTMPEFFPAVVLREFIQVLGLENLRIAAHYCGAAAALAALFVPALRGRIKSLALIDAALPGCTPSPFAAQLASADPKIQPLCRHADPRLSAYLLLREYYADPAAITDAAVEAASEALACPNAVECLAFCASLPFGGDPADFRRRLTGIDIPILILWGEKDSFSPLDHAFELHRLLPRSTVRIISGCGHAPQMEAPRETAGILTAFFASCDGRPSRQFDPSRTVAELDIPAEPSPAAKTPKPATHMPEGLRFRKLFDRWNVGTITLLVFIKILQLLKKCGMRGQENGWRAATGIFLRNEYSKFLLGSFRLRYCPEYLKPTSHAEAKLQLIRRLGEFLREQGDYYWAVQPGLLKLSRRKVFFIDIVEAEYDAGGKIVRLIPHFDDRQQSFHALSPAGIEAVINLFIREYNQLRSSSERVRAQELGWRLAYRTRRLRGIGVPAKIETKLLLDRLMTATFIHFEFDCDETLRRRLRTPDLNKRRHPGWGLLNIFCRFTSDLSETDLWFQYHHVPVDGVPMQEILEKLKEQWGTAGSIVFPALDSTEARPEVIYCGDRVFRARVYIDFAPLLKLRSYLNSRFSAVMEGPATVAGMVIWGMMHHEYFRDGKVLFPVDLAEPEEITNERELSLVFIRPNRYYYPDRKLASFVLFQREFNRRIAATRLRRSESYELLELYSMINPIFYYIARYFMPESTAEMLGSMGLSIIKNADVFVSPLSDLQFHGFMAIGNLCVPTADGRTAGCVSICARRNVIKYYIRALAELGKYAEFLDLDEKPC